MNSINSHTGSISWRSLLHFVGAISVLCLVIFVLAPIPLKHFKPFNHYAAVAEQNDIHPGALYYSDVSVTRASENNSRDTVRFFYNLPRSLQTKQDVHQYNE